MQTPGSHIEVTLHFNQAVTVSGTPRIELSPAFGPNGETRYATYVSGSPGTTLVFRYTLVEEDSSDGVNVSVAANALDGSGAGGRASIRAGGTDVSTAHAAYDSGKRVSTGAPEITQAWALLPPTTDGDLDGSGDTYTVGKRFSVLLKFEADIEVANSGTNGANARIVITIGSTDYTLNYESTASGNSGNSGTVDDGLSFGPHTVVAADRDADGITVKRDAAGNLVRLSGDPGATIRSKDNGNDAVLTADADMSIQAVAGVPARVRGTNSVPSGKDFTKATGINVDLTFARSDFKITDSDGDPLKEVRVATLPGSAHGVLKLDGTAIPAADLPKTVTYTELDEGKLVFTPTNDYEGNAAFTFRVVDSFGGVAASAKTATIKVVPLHVTGVEITSTPSKDADDNGTAETYVIGNKVRVRLTFNEAVDVDTDGGRPRLKIKMDPGWGEKWAVYESGSGSDQLTFVHVVVWPNHAPRGIAVLANTLELNGGTIKSVANQANAALEHAGLGHDPDHLVDTDICGRTPQVRDALVQATGKSCTEVSDADLGWVFVLDLGEKEISSLKPGDFDGLPYLRNLYLDYNDLTTLPKGVFRGMPRLNYLKLFGTPLGTLPANAFGNLGSLDRLDLRGTELTAIHEDAFDGLPNLQWLDLAENELTTVPASVFDGNTRLRSVGLGWNEQLSTLPEGVFDGLSNLRSLILCFNDLTALPDGVFEDLTSLEWLQLQANDIEELDAGVFDGLTKLETLNLNSNEMWSLPDGIFSDLTSLEDLHLRYMPGSPFDLSRLGVRDGAEVEQ